MKVHRLSGTGLVGLVVVATLFAGAVPASAAPGDGSAYAAKIAANGPLGIPTVNLGPLAASNTAGPTTNSLVSIAGVPANLVSAGVMATSAVRDNATGHVDSDAFIAEVAVTLGPLKATVEAIGATCNASEAGVNGSATVAGASLLGLTIPINPGPNTKLAVTIPNPVPLLPPINIATLTLNEQILHGDGSLTVNAFHLSVLTGSVISNLVGSGDIIFASATCGPAAPPIPLASGAGLLIGLGLLGMVVIPVSVSGIRRRRGLMAA